MSTGTSAGVGFAIPSSTVVKIVPQLIQFSKVSMKKIYCFVFLIGLLPSIFWNFVDVVTIFKTLGPSSWY